MRLITWNCRVGNFRDKVKHIAGYKPDILAVQEVQLIDDVTTLEGDIQPAYKHRPNFPDLSSRSTGMFSYNKDIIITAVDDPDQQDWRFSFRRYQAKLGDLSFQVVNVWPFASKDDHKGAYRQIHKALKDKECRKWVNSGLPTVILGDFNNNASYIHYDWSELEELLGSLDLGSAYHHYFHEKFGKESCPTYFHKGQSVTKVQLDYCFLPKNWLPMIDSVKVCDYSEWEHISDHVPLIVDLNLP